MAYLIFALVPLVMVLLLVMPRLEAWCTNGPGPLDPLRDSGVEPALEAVVGELPA